MRALLLSLLAGVVAVATPPAPAQKAPRVALRAEAFSSRAAGKIHVTVLGQPEVPGTKLLTAAIELYDAGDKLVGRWTAKATDLTGLTIMGTFDVAPGRYRARLTVTAAVGRAGSADIAVDANLTPAAGGLSVSSTEIGDAGPPFAPKLQFTNEPTAAVYFELYGGKPSMPVSISLELAATPTGPPLVTLQPKITATPEPDRYIVTAPIDLAALAPGDYVIREIVGLDGFPATRILRTIRKTQ